MGRDELICACSRRCSNRAAFASITFPWRNFRSRSYRQDLQLNAAALAAVTRKHAVSRLAISYPFGGPDAVSAQVERVAQDAGLRIGFTTERAVNATLETSALVCDALTRTTYREVVGRSSIGPKTRWSSAAGRRESGESSSSRNCQVRRVSQQPQHEMRSSGRNPVDRGAGCQKTYLESDRIGRFHPTLARHLGRAGNDGRRRLGRRQVDRRGSARRARSGGRTRTEGQRRQPDRRSGRPGSIDPEELARRCSKSS